MKNKNIIMLVGGCLVGYAGIKLVGTTVKKVNKIVREQRIKKGRLVEINGEYCKAEWI